jgi:protocatechuate 3,4-dioxygenase beta subunit
VKLAACLMIAASCLRAQEAPATTCFVSGRVLNAANNEPVRRAHLTLRRKDNPAGGSGMSAAFVTTTDDHGRFAMKDIEPGKYDFSAKHAGFADTGYGARRPGRPGVTLSLDAGQQLTGVVFRLVPQAVITGRVLDADGDPVQGVQVTTARYRYEMGKRQLLPSGYAGTDDLGEYRLFGLAPGRYYLQATYRDLLSLQGIGVTSKPVQESYVPTYYPGVTDPSSATPLDLSAGTQLRGMDFTLTKVRAVNVRGHVIVPASANRRVTTIMLAPREMAFWGSMRRLRGTDAQGSFEVAGVAPGSYTLTASVQDGQKTLFAYQHLEVGNSNIDDVTLSLTTGAELPGQLRFEGQPPASLNGIEVSLEEFEGYEFRMGPQPSAEMKDDGTFTLPSIAAELYRARVRGLPDGYYLKSVRLGDDELKDTGIDATHELSGTLLVTVSSRAGLIEGVVQNDKDQPVPGASVVLVPEPKKRGRSDEFEHVTTDQYGRYIVKSIAPGDYKLFAFEDMEPGEYMDPEFLKPVEEQGVKIGIREGSRENTDLKQIPAKPPAKSGAK